MNDSGQENEGLFAQIDHFLKQARENPQSEVSSGDIQRILGQIGEVSMDQNYREDPHFADPAAFALEVAGKHGEVVAVVDLSSPENQAADDNARTRLQNRRADELRDKYGVILGGRGQNQELTGIKSGDIKYGNIIIRRGAALLERPKADETPKTVELLLEEFNEKIDQLPKEAHKALADYSDWYTERGSYDKQTGISLDAAHEAQLISRDQYNLIKEAKGRGDGILANKKPFAVPSKVVVGAGNDEEAEEGKKFVWAVVPAVK